MSTANEKKAIVTHLCLMSPIMNPQCHKSIGTGKKYKTCLSSGVTDWNVVFFFLPVPPIMKMINREKRETDRIKWSLHRRELLG